MFCQNCGAKIESNDRFCPNCGVKIEQVFNRVSLDNKNQEEINVNDKEIYASAWQRLGAYLIDIAILIVAFFLLGIILDILGVDITPDTEDSLNFLSIFVSWTYFAFQESSEEQATIGQKALHIKVVDYNFKRISFWRATGRHFAQIISALILMIGYLMIFFTKKRQGLHDMIAGTLVIRD